MIKDNSALDQNSNMKSDKFYFEILGDNPINNEFDHSQQIKCFNPEI